MKLTLFCRSLTKLPVVFYSFENSNKFLRYKGSKSVSSIVSLWNAQTKNAKKDNFSKNISSPTVLKQNSLNFHSLNLKDDYI